MNGGVSTNKFVNQIRAAHPSIPICSPLNSLFRLPHIECVVCIPSVSPRPICKPKANEDHPIVCLFFLCVSLSLRIQFLFRIRNNRNKQDHCSIRDKTHHHSPSSRHFVSVPTRSNIKSRWNMLGNSENKLSDFSIDHILNRAGASPSRKNHFCTQQRVRDYTKNFILHQTDPTTSPNTAVALNWLQYSRYHPPKLQRKKDILITFKNIFMTISMSFIPSGHMRAGPAKRTPGRLPRVPFTPEQLTTLEGAYRKSTYLSSEDANKLADRLDLSNVRYVLST